MNIAEAKDMIRDTVRIYLKKNEFGEYVIPYMKQRPIYMVGAPGIGKTAILEQVAQEFGIPVVSFSMTHLSKENAVGIPVIKRVPFGDRYREVTEYTVSEIIATVYRVIEEGGKEEGILFLDEINCVSESLVPFMLLFLQYKRFGNKELPPGWVIVAAGNQKEYNSAAIDFELAIKDRLRYLYVEPDVTTWLAYARKGNVHPSIIGYLSAHGDHFYSLKRNSGDVEFVTARGWEDLSNALIVYEDEGLSVSLSLIRQYVADFAIAESFYEYYQVCSRYVDRGYYDMIFAGHTSIVGLNTKTLDREYRMALLSRLVSEIAVCRKRVFFEEEKIQMLDDAWQSIVQGSNDAGLRETIAKRRAALAEEMAQEESAGRLGRERRHAYICVFEVLEQCLEQINGIKRPELDRVNGVIEAERALAGQKMSTDMKLSQAMIDAAVDFVQENWPNGEEAEYFSTALRYV